MPSLWIRHMAKKCCLSLWWETQKKVMFLQEEIWSTLTLRPSRWRYGEVKGNLLPYSCLENPTDGGAWQTALHRVSQSRTQLSDFTFTFHFLALEKEMATHSSVLAWRIPGMGEPGGLPSMRLHRIRHDWSDLAAAAAGGDSINETNKQTNKTEWKKERDGEKKKGKRRLKKDIDLGITKRYYLRPWAWSRYPERLF